MDRLTEITCEKLGPLRRERTLGTKRGRKLLTCAPRCGSVPILHLDRATVRTDGSLISDAAITRCGVFLYENPDGSPLRILRPPEEVFKRESLDTLRLRPLTLLHPDHGVVSPETFADSNVIGTVGSDVARDGDNVVSTVAAMDAEALAAYKGGMRQLSAGYHAERLTEVSGVADDGTPYHYKAPGVYVDSDGNAHPFDLIQANIVYNHVAMVPAGRAGTARFLDSAAGHDMKHTDAAGVTQVTESAEDKSQKVDAGSESVPHADQEQIEVKIGGVGFMVEPALAALIGMLQEQAGQASGVAAAAPEAEEPAEAPESLENAAEEEQDSAELDSLKAENDALKAELAKSRDAAIMDSVGPFLDAASIERPTDIGEAIRAAIKTKVPGAPVEHFDSVESAFATWKVLAQLPATEVPTPTNDSANLDFRARADAAWAKGAPPLTRN